MATSTTIRFGPPRDPEHVPALARLLNLAFSSPIDQVEATYLRVVGLDQMRVAVSAEAPPDAAPGACLARLPMGQFFGGRSVPMVGIAAVAVAPEARGRGLALAMMREAVLEMHREGVPISCLYPSTQALYRQVGFEQAGHRFRYELDLARIGVTDRSMPVRALSGADEAAVRDCQRRFAQCGDGMLDRCELLWKRTRHWRGSEYHGWGVSEKPGGELEGFVFLRQTMDAASFRMEISISDLAFTTARAGRRLLGFLADFGSMARSVEMFGGPVHPVVNLMPQQGFRSEFKFHWMLRIVDAPKAVAARGFAPGVDAEVGIALHDDLIPENRGVWALRVSGTRGVLQPASGPALVETDIRGLACLYAGFLSVPQAALVGLVRGSPEGLAALASVFPAGCAGMNDMF